MWGQVVQQLIRPEMKPHWYYHDKYIKLSAYNAGKFRDNAGLPSWEKKYGKAVDEVSAKLR